MLMQVGDAKVKLCKELGSASGPGQPLLIDFGVDEIDEGERIKEEEVEEGEIRGAETVAEGSATKGWLPKEQHAANKKRIADESLAAPHQRDKRRIDGTSTYHVGNRLAAAIASANNLNTTSGAVVLFDTNSASVAPFEVCTLKQALNMVNSANPTPLQPTIQPIVPITEKTWCTHWIRTGTCSFTQQGCLYIHEMPSPAILASLGFREVPRWFREKQLADQLAMIDKASIANVPSIKQEADSENGEIVSESGRNQGRMYCIYWVRMGRCDFTKQGCRYLHEMPSPMVLAALGFLETPGWYLEAQNPLKTQTQLPPSEPSTQSQALVRVDETHPRTIGANTQRTTSSPTPPNQPPTNINNTTISSTRSHRPRSTHISSFHPDVRIKDPFAYCTTYLRLGICAAISPQECTYLHTPPPHSVFVALGYKDLPKWYTAASSVSTVGDVGTSATHQPHSATRPLTEKDEVNDDTKSRSTMFTPSRSSSATTSTLPSTAHSLPPRPPPPTGPGVSPFPQNTQSSPPRNLSTPKSHCTHYLRTGHCSFSSQGQRCRFSHIFPTTRSELLALGFKCLPEWYVRQLALQGLGPPEQSQQVLGPSSRRDDALCRRPPAGPRIPSRGIGGNGNWQTGKVYCNHFLKTGECDYMQTGCAFLHEYPPPGESPFTS